MAESHRDEIAKLEELFAANPEGRIFTPLAEAYRKAGELERARETVEQGIERHTDYASAHVVLGRVLTDLGDAEGAERAFRRVLELDPENRVALRGLGDLAREAGRSAEAVEHYRALLLLDPSDAEIEKLARSAEEQARAAGAMIDSAEEPEDERAAGGPAIASTGPASPGEESGGGAPGSDPAAIVETAGVADPGADDAAMAAAAGTGDADASAAGNIVVEAGASDFEASIGAAEGAVEPGSDDALDLPVKTETMADLYAGQGLLDQAAEVYRDLLRSRPGDERLVAKLGDVEARIAKRESPAEVSPDGAGEVGPEADGLEAAGPVAGAGEESAQSGPPPELVLTGLDEVEETEAAEVVEPLAGLVPEEAQDQTVEAEAGTRLEGSADWLDGLRNPSSSEVASAPPERFSAASESAGSEEYGDSAVDSQAAARAENASGAAGDEKPSPAEGAAGDTADQVMELEADEVVELGADQVMELEAAETEEGAILAFGELEAIEAVQAEESEDGAEVGVPSMSPIGAEPGRDAEEVVDLPMLEVPDTADSVDEPPHGSGPTIGEYLRALLVFRSATPAGDSGSSAAGNGLLVLDEATVVTDAGTASDEFDELFADPANPGESAEGDAGDAGEPTSVEGRDTGNDDDDDLEMFRTWLQNLKH